MSHFYERQIGSPIYASSTRSRSSKALLGALLLGVLSLACSSGGPSEPRDRTPVISVTGVQAGQQLTGPVTIVISVDVGTFSAFLNGQPFQSGTTVSASGAYLLDVSARNGSATANLSLDFTIIAAGSRLIIRMFDLGANDAGGGGDAILLTDSSSSGQRHVLVDAGPAGVGGSDPNFVLRELQALGINTLEALVLSHAHSDHFSGMSPIIRGLTVKQFVYNGQVRSLSFYQSVLNDAQQFADQVSVVSSTLSLTFGDGAVVSSLTVLPPLGTYLGNGSATSSQINEGSLGAELSKGGFRMFLTGDSEVEANQRWRVQFANRSGDVEVLKVGHHGANDAVFDNGFSGSSAWLTHTSPEIALVTANGTSHPRINAVNFLLGLSGTRTYCTNVHGDITVRVEEDGAYQVTVEKNSSAVCAPGSGATT